jgi:hypothetical protein
MKKEEEGVEKKHWKVHKNAHFFYRLPFNAAKFNPRPIVYHIKVALIDFTSITCLLKDWLICLQSNNTVPAYAMVRAHSNTAETVTGLGSFLYHYLFCFPCRIQLSLDTAKCCNTDTYGQTSGHTRYLSRWKSTSLQCKRSSVSCLYTCNLTALSVNWPM